MIERHGGRRYVVHVDSAGVHGVVPASALSTAQLEVWRRDPGLALAEADMEAWSAAHPCECDARCVCGERP